MLIKSEIIVSLQTIVVIFHLMAGVSEKNFANPREFIPERWIKDDPLESFHHPYTILPFGFGKRMCIGRRLAELEMWQLTIKVSRLYCNSFRQSPNTASSLGFKYV